MASTEDLRAAVASLEVSTSAIQKEAEILEKNRVSLETFRAENSTTDDSERHRARRLANQNLSLMVEESSVALIFQLNRLEEDALCQINSVQTSLKQYLLQDDRHLQALVALSVVDPDDGHELKERAAKLVSLHSNFNQQEIESQLSRTYLQHLRATSIAEGRTETKSDEQQVEQDLKSLYVEIPDVAKMSATQEFQIPLINAIDTEQNRKNTQTERALGDINTSIGHMASSAERCVDRLEAMASYNNALSVLREEVQALDQRFRGAKEIGKQVGHGEVPPSALKEMLEHWNVSATGVASIEPGLVSRKLKLQNDIDQSIRGLDDVFQSHLKTLPLDVTQILQQEQVTGDLDQFDEEIQELKKALDQVNVACLEDDEHDRARFLKRWAVE